MCPVRAPNSQMKSCRKTKNCSIIPQMSTNRSTGRPRNIWLLGWCGILAVSLCVVLLVCVCGCRTSKQERRAVSFSRSFDTNDTSSSLCLPSIVDELRSHDYDVDVLPFFQRISVSGEEMSGVSAAVVLWHFPLCTNLRYDMNPTH